MPSNKAELASVTSSMEKQLQSPGQSEALGDQRYPQAETADSRVVPQGMGSGEGGRVEGPRECLSLGESSLHTGRKDLGFCGSLPRLLTWGLSLVKMSLPRQHPHAFLCAPSRSPWCPRPFFLSFSCFEHRI